MQKIVLQRKTGFNNIGNSPIVIRDMRHKIFYDTRPLRKHVTQFNLPEGSYYIESGKFVPRGTPVKYKLVRLPRPERNKKMPLDFAIIWGKNPSKCTIDWVSRTITFDHELKRLSLPELFFILYHEYGHALYSTEKYADLFSSNLMKKKGYNPSQIGAAPITSLSCRQIDRKRFLVDKLINI